MCEHHRTLRNILSWVFEDTEIKSPVWSVLWSYKLQDHEFELARIMQKLGWVYEISSDVWKHVGEAGRSRVEKTTVQIKAAINPSVKLYADAPPAKHRAVALHERISQIAIKVLDLIVKTVQHGVPEGIWMKQKKLEMNERKEMKQTCSLP